MNVLVTGANGLIGRAVCEELNTRGMFVRAAVRRACSLPVSEILEVGDITGETDWSKALAGIDVVFHIAGIAHLRSLSTKDRELLQRVNVEATRGLAEAASNAAVKRFVFLSTAKVYGETSGARPFRETDVPTPTDLYAVAKLEAERIVTDTIADRAIIVRTPLVYGPRVKANFLSLMRTIDRGLPLPLGAVHNSRTLIFVRNLADAMIELATGSASGIFNAGDAAPVSTPELIRAIARALNRKARLMPVPPAALRMAASLIGARNKVEKVIGSFALETTKLASTGWRPRHTFEAGLTETAAWFRSGER